MDGWIGSVGGVIKSTTEIHHIERKLEVSYRFDKEFSGMVKNNSSLYEQKNIFFCRDLDFYNETMLGSDLSLLYEDLEQARKIKEININNDFLLEYVSYSDIFEMTKKQLFTNPYYLLSKRDDMYSG